MSEPNFAGNIIVNLASLPDFLRTPILKKRMTEFFSKNDDEKAEIIINALNAGPTIPFPNFGYENKHLILIHAGLSELDYAIKLHKYIQTMIQKPKL